MAQKMTVMLEDDLDGGPAAETVRFGVGGTEYKIDLNEKNASNSRRSSNMPAGPEGDRAGCRGVPPQAASAAAPSGFGPRTKGSRSARVGASPPPWLSSTTQPPEEADTGPWLIWPSRHRPCRSVANLALGISSGPQLLKTHLHVLDTRRRRHQASPEDNRPEAIVIERGTRHQRVA
jgi:Lsr2